MVAVKPTLLSLALLAWTSIAAPAELDLPVADSEWEDATGVTPPHLLGAAPATNLTERELQKRARPSEILVCEDANFQGRCAWHWGSGWEICLNIHSSGWGDRISSMESVDATHPCTYYADTGCRGSNIRTVNHPDLSLTNMNDRISSYKCWL